MSKHTPGPWKTRPSVNYGDVYIVPSDYDDMASGCIALAENETDARLIAAAPDLLAALQELLAAQQSADDAVPVWHSAWDAADAAITKAIGEQP